MKIKHDAGRLVAVLTLCPPAELSGITPVAVPGTRSPLSSPAGDKEFGAFVLF